MTKGSATKDRCMVMAQFAVVMSRLPNEINKCSCKYIFWLYLKAEICELFLTFNMFSTNCVSHGYKRTTEK